MSLEELPSSMTVFRLPKSHWHCELANYDFTPETRMGVELFVSGTYRHLLLTGKPGLGKSHLSVGLYRWAVTCWGTRQATWLEFPYYCQQVKRTYGDDYVDPYEPIDQATEFVALDDIFGRKLSEHEQEHILYSCIQIAHRNRSRLVITTNYTLDQLTNMIDPHELDRVLESCLHLKFEGESRR